MEGITLTTGRGTTVARRARSRGPRGVEPLPNSPETAMADPARPTTRGGATRFVPTGNRAHRAIRGARPPVLSSAGVVAPAVPVGCATHADHGQVARAPGYGLVAAIGTVRRSGRAWLRLPIGSVIGLRTVQILGSLSTGREGAPNCLPSPMALAVTVITGVGGGRIRGHGDAIRESSVVTPERRSRAVGGGSRGWSTPGGRGGGVGAQGDGP